MSSATCLSRSASVTVEVSEVPICALTRLDTTEERELELAAPMSGIVRRGRGDADGMFI